MNNNIFDSKLSFSIVGLYYNKVKNSILLSIGCELSYWDGDRILETVNQHEKQIIINTCAVTESSLYASTRVAQKMKLLFPEHRIYITGCGVDYKQIFGEIGIQLKNSQKFDLNNYSQNENFNNDIFKHYATDEYGYVKIQEGCNNNCSYCTIPRLRKKVFSHSYDDIRSQIETHIKTGKSKISLIGTEVCKYSHGGMNLLHMVNSILRDFPQIDTIRFNALDPSSPILDDILELCKKEKRMSKEIELSVQSCSDKVLHDMNRKYGKDRLYQIGSIAGEELKMCWHIIVGFPTETDELFEETVRVIQDIRPCMISIHDYSEREGTESSKMKYMYDVSKIKCRHNRLNSLQSSKIGKNSIIKTIGMNFPAKEIRNGDIEYIDLYTDNGLTKAFSILSQGFSDVIVVNYDVNKDQRELELNCKLLNSIFGARIVVIMNINDSNIEYFTDNVQVIYDTGVYFSVFIRLNIDNIQNTNNMVNFIKRIKKFNSYDMDMFYEDIKKNNDVVAELVYDI